VPCVVIDAWDWVHLSTTPLLWRSQPVFIIATWAWQAPAAALDAGAVPRADAGPRVSVREGVCVYVCVRSCVRRADARRAPFAS